MHLAENSLRKGFLKKLKKKSVCIVLAMILFIMTTVSVSAHEYAQPLRWLPKTNGYAHLKLNYSAFNLVLYTSII